MKTTAPFTIKKLIKFLSVFAVFITIANLAFSQCSVTTPPAYSNTCSTDYYEIITATGTAGVTSTINYPLAGCVGTYFNYYTTQGITTPLGATINVNIKRATGYK